MKHIVVVAHNIRSAHNVGSIFRTCDGFGVEKLVLSGYTPYPELPSDTRLPHIRQKITRLIHKTALGAELSLPCEQVDQPPLDAYRHAGYTIIALEQTPSSLPLPQYQAPDKLVLLLGEEVHGVPDELLSQCEVALEIPMCGSKESFNVSVAAGIALYQLSTIAYNITL